MASLGDTHQAWNDDPTHAVERAREFLELLPPSLEDVDAELRPRSCRRAC